MSDIGSRIKIIREEYHITQVDFANRLGVTNAHISKIEKGKTVPSTALIKLICSEFRINEEWLTKGISPMLIEELETATEIQIEKAMMMFNKSLNTDNPIIRAEVAKLYNSFVSLISFERIQSEYVYDYLIKCQSLLNDMNNIFEIMKNYAYNNQQFIDIADISSIFEKQITNIINDINDIRCFFEEQYEKLSLKKD